VDSPAAISPNKTVKTFCDKGFEEIAAAMEASAEADLQMWGRWVRACEPAGLHAAARSLVTWSDSGDLAGRYRHLTSRMYLYGAQRGLPDHLHGIVDEPTSRSIAGSGRFPMIDNSNELWTTVAAAVVGADECDRDGAVCVGVDAVQPNPVRGNHANTGAK
jgi:hypothetical protein